MPTWASQRDFDAAQQLSSKPDTVQPVYVLMPDAGMARVVLKPRADFNRAMNVELLHGAHVGHTATSQYCSFRETQPHQAGYLKHLDQLMRLSAYYARNCHAYDQWVTLNGLYTRPHIVVIYIDRARGSERLIGARTQVIFESNPKPLLSIDDLQSIYEKSTFFFERKERNTVLNE
jgi:hypothetical protein